MDKCNMDYDNIELYYEESEGDVVTTENHSIVIESGAPFW